MIKQPKILIIDDDEMILRLAKVLLEEISQPNVDTICGSSAALIVLKQYPATHFDLILLDLNMPGIDGVQFLRLLADLKYSGTLAILSGAAINVLQTVEDLAVAHKLNILGSIKKPVTKESLADLLLRYDQNQSVQHGQAYSDNAKINAKDIENALINNEFFLVFQPKVCAQTKKLVGVEALCRWIHPEKGFISPAAFIPVAEQTGLINKLTKYVIKTAIHEIKRLHSVDLKIQIGINISMTDLDDLDFPNFLINTAKDADLDHEYIILELTESRLSENIKNSLEVFIRLNLLRIKLSIDDFGTGYSSQEKLLNLPFYELKIDQSFVNNVHKERQLQAILSSNIQLAKSLGLKTTVEGIESFEDWQYVADQGCDVIQGFFVAKPMTMNALISWATIWDKFMI